MWFQPKPKPLFYLQANIPGYEEHINSMILSCQMDNTELDILSNQLANYINSLSLSSPLIWEDIMSEKLLYTNHGSKGLEMGNLIRNNCNVINTHVFTPGSIQGGKRGTKYIHKPSYTKTSYDFPSTKDHIIHFLVCPRLNGKYECKLEKRQGTLNELKLYQNTIENMIINREQKRWENANILLDLKTDMVNELQKIQKNEKL